ncbi:MAG: hypothetical protein EOO03_09490 [Chitinophagaceae bacterium]|nr:MAG: hypothetical protein EOO03_09490 [Chitinophagaceae bacterium]
MFYYYLIGIIAGLVAVAGIVFMVQNGTGNRYQRKQLKKLYKRSRREKIEYTPGASFSNHP